MDTIQDLEHALEATRMQSNGITLNLVARIIGRVFDKAEIRALINELTILNK